MADDVVGEVTGGPPYPARGRRLCAHPECTALAGKRKRHCTVHEASKRAGDPTRKVRDRKRPDRSGRQGEAFTSRARLSITPEEWQALYRAHGIPVESWVEPAAKRYAKSA